MGINTKGELTETEKKFIEYHHGSISLREMAKRLGRGAKIINDYKKQEGLTDGSGKKDTRRHPWRKANHQLGLYILTSESKTYKSSGRDKK